MQAPKQTARIIGGLAAAVTRCRVGIDAPVDERPPGILAIKRGR